MHLLQDALCLRHQLEAYVAVLLERLGHILLGVGVSELRRLRVAAGEELLHRLLQVRGPQAQQQRGPRALLLLLRLLPLRLRALLRRLLRRPWLREVLEPIAGGLRTRALGLVWCRLVALAIRCRILGSVRPPRLAHLRPLPVVVLGGLSVRRQRVLLIAGAALLALLLVVVGSLAVGEHEGAIRLWLRVDLRGAPCLHGHSRGRGSRDVVL
mmetsp:Transcript_37217/g.96132  ORF Transcript_37217/g.96132 Transcript_37217/m.96132 type:complete len:212 (+) Transcript_37217:1152-1787(+)